MRITRKMRRERKSGWTWDEWMQIKAELEIAKAMERSGKHPSVALLDIDEGYRWAEWRWM